MCEARFAETFVRARYGRGQGPLLIGRALGERGVDGKLADELLAGADFDWRASARAVRERRFGEATPDDPRERARQVRFLASRGFTGEQVRFATGKSFDTD